MVHVGVDLDKHNSQIAVLTDDGEIVQQRLANEATLLEKFFAQLPRQTPVAIEASGTWWWLVDLLEQLGHRPVLSNPKQTKAIAAARLKNDRVDAERLALLLRGDLLPTVWIPPAALREARELVRHRIQLVWLRGVIRNRLQAMLARRNLQPTSGKSWLTQRGQRELQQLPLPEAPSRIREDCAALLPTLDAQIRRLDVDLVTRWGQDPRVQRLMTIPGIGSLHRDRARPRARGHPPVRDRQAGRQLRRLDAPGARQCRAGARRPHHEGRQPPPALGVGARGDAGREAARSAAGVVSRGEKAARQESGPGRAGAATRGDRLSRLATGVRLLHRRPSRCRAGVSSDVDMVFGPPS